MTRKAPIIPATAPDAPIIGMALPGANRPCASAPATPVKTNAAAVPLTPQYSSRLDADGHRKIMLKIRWSQPACMNMCASRPSVLRLAGT